MHRLNKQLRPPKCLLGTPIKTSFLPTHFCGKQGFRIYRKAARAQLQDVAGLGLKSEVLTKPFMQGGQAINSVRLEPSRPCGPNNGKVPNNAKFPGPAERLH